MPPADEKTWRNQKTLHIVFAGTTLLMVVATVWMTAKDHMREWKDVQRKGIHADTKMIKWRREQAMPPFFTKSLEEAENDVIYSRVVAPTEDAIESFKQIAAKTEEETGEKFDFTQLDLNVEELRPLVKTAKEAVDKAVASQADSLSAKAAYVAAKDKLATEDEPSDEDKKKLEDLKQKSEDAVKTADQLQASALKLAKDMEPTRRDMLDAMRRIIGRVRFFEDNAVREKKAASAQYDAAKANRGLAVSTGKPTAALQEEVDRRKAKLDALTVNVQTLETQRLALEEIVANYTKAESAAIKIRDRTRADVARLEAALEERELTGAKEILNLPILSAFNSPLKVDQIWLPELTLYNNFKHVARFDRCTTCHMFMNKSKPGEPYEPAFEKERVKELVLATPDVAPKSTDQTLRKMYGMDIAAEGLIDPNSATVMLVWPKVMDEDGDLVSGRAARAGLQMADVIERINGERITSPDVARQLLLNPDAWGTPIKLSIRRGFPQPYQTHPRLDLFMSDSSPHPMQKFGCTICHEGQGSATEFKWASHTPNSIGELKEFEKKGWFDNHHWIFPMLPERFNQASCLKCHHEVEQLEPSERFPDPPAPKLVEGYNLVREYGCFGCHEINGYDGPDKRIGPDMRLEPNYYAAALQLLQDPSLTEKEREAAQHLVVDPSNTKIRQELYEWLLTDDLSVARALKDEHIARAEAGEDLLGEDDLKLVEAVIAKPEDRAARQQLAAAIQSGKLAVAGIDDAKAMRNNVRLTDESQALVALLKDSDTPGDMRKVGPSLRYVAKKVDRAYLYNWIEKPSSLRPDTRMPQFFGLHDHLTLDDPNKKDKSGKTKIDREAHDLAKKYEPLEIRSMTDYLLNASQPFEYIKPEDSITEAPSAERGKRLFESRGCLACHKRKGEEGFANAEATQGPNLTLVGAKFANQDGEKGIDWGKAKDWGEGKLWLYTWLRNPSHYNPRARMPDLKLEPIKQSKAGEDGEEAATTVTDPAADIVEYLAIKGKDDPEPKPIPQLDPGALDLLVAEHLSKSFTEAKVKQYLNQGIYDRKPSSLKVDELELLTDGNPSPRVLEQKKLMYLGRRSISKYGCAGCHDIPGFEAAKPIGTALADWGRKDPSKLAFEHIFKYVGLKHQKHAAAEHAAEKDGHGHDHSHASDGLVRGQEDQESEVSRKERRDYLEHMLMGHHREGFLWQKLTEPRSYDYKMAKNKPYNDRLRMPKFPLKDSEIESIMTFVLGLVAEPPRAQYVFQPDRDQQAIVDGRKVIAKFNCAGCHQMQQPQWELEYSPGYFADQAPDFKDFAFLRPQLGADAIKDSLQVNNRGMRTAKIIGDPALNSETGEIDKYWWSVEDEERVLESDLPDIEGEVYEAVDFHIIQPVVLDGRVFDGRGVAVRIKLSDVRKQYPDLPGQARWPWHGGDLGRWIFRSAVKHEKETSNPNATARDSWSWLPPTLVGEGDKVQTDWLHSFLLDPHVIRPATILRMPKFTMSSDDASKLVDYFAAMDRARYPYVYSPRQSEAHLVAAAAAYQKRLPEDERGKRTRLGDAMKLSTNICSQCHLMGDFSPGGNPRALAPQFDDVHARLRPDWVRSYIANPTRHIWYTGMPVNFPPGKEYTDKEKKLFLGTSVQHIDAVTDLLMHWSKENSRSIKGMVPKQSPEGEGESGDAGVDAGKADAEKPDEGG